MPWRGSDGSVSGGSYESWIEKQIREAQARGDFDDLPGAGKPLQSTRSDPDWWIRDVAKREGLNMSAVVSPGLALRKEAEELPDRVLRERSERAVRDLVDDFNVRVREFWMGSHDGPVVVVRTADADDLVAAWRAHRATRHQVASAHESDEPAAPGWWRQLRERWSSR